MTRVVLITGIGGDISQGVATILRESRPDLRLVGVDAQTQHGGHLFVDAFETVPSANDPNYAIALQAVIARYAVSVVIPMSEAELVALLKVDSFNPGLKWISSGSKAVTVGVDKLATIRAIQSLGIPVPWTVPISEGEAPSYPCILKSRFGSGSRSVVKIESLEDERFFRKKHPDWILQEMLEPADRELTCAVYRRQDGDVSALIMLRRLTGGFTGWARVISDTDTSRMCERISVGLDLQGSMNIQLRITDKGPRVFEINPRFSSTVLMRHLIGFSDVLWAIEEAEGKSFEFPVIPSGKMMVRVQGAACFDDAVSSA